MELLNGSGGPRRRAQVLAFVLALGGCIGTSPEDAARAALGPDPGPYRNGPLHRAGFPCGVCHGTSATPSFAAAGTVYTDASGELGLQGATITIRDHSGLEVTATSNQVGNFFFVSSGGTRRGDSRGQATLSAPLEYPISVRVSFGGSEQKMRGLIWREQSCAACHRGHSSSISNGVVFLESPP